MKRLVLVIAFGLTTAGAAHAAPTNIPFVICGSEKCVTTENPAVTQAPQTWSTFVPTARPAPPQPYYWVGFGAQPWQPVPKGFYIPGPSLLRVSGGRSTLASWVKLTPAEAAAFRAAVKHLTPYPRPAKLDHVIVDHGLVQDPSSYLRLWTLGQPARSASGAGSWLAVSFSSQRASPWTDGLVQLAVSRHGAYLKREGRVYAIPTAVARRARAGRSLRG